jgi:hypothetical protein
MKTARYNGIWIALLLTALIRTSSYAGEIWLEAGLNPLGDDFPLELYGRDISDLYGLAFEVSYSSAPLAVVDSDGDPSNGIRPLLVEGAVLNQGGSVPTLLAGGLDQAGAGRVVLGLTRAGQVGGVSVSGKQLLLTIMMTQNVDPTGPIVLDPVHLEDGTSHSIPVGVLSTYTYRSTGTVQVSVTPTSASWSLVDGDGQIHNGVGNQTIRIPTGVVTLAWEGLATYYRPAPNPTSATLDRNATVAFSGVYVPRPKVVLDSEPAFTPGTSNQISWGVLADADEYFLQWSTNSRFAPVAGNSGWVAAVAHRADALADGQTYYYRAKWHDRNRDESGWSAATSSTQDATPPGVPGTPTDPGVYISATSVRFNWTTAADSVSGVASYELQVGTRAGGSDVFNGNVGNVLTRDVTGGNGQRLYARVRARDGAGNIGAWSSNSNGILIDTAAPGAPGAPADEGTYTTSTAVRFGWTAATDPGTSPSGVASYDLQVGTAPGASNVFNGNVGSVLTRTVTGANGQRLYARVRARDGAGNIGAWSSNSDGILIDTEAPEAPGAPADEGTYTSSTAVRFGWTAAIDPGTSPSGVASYDLQVGTAPGASNVFNGNVGSVLTRTVTGANGQRLYARVRARDGAGNLGAWSSNSDGILIDTAAPVSAMAPLSPWQGNPNIPLTWSGVDLTSGSGLLDFTIYASENDGPFTSLVSNTTATSTTYPGQSGSRYAFYSIARDRAGNVEDAPSVPDVSLDVMTPAIRCLPTSLSLLCAAGGPVSSTTLWVSNATTYGTVLLYAIETSSMWLTCSPTTGTSTGEATTHTVLASPAGLNAGDYRGTVTISSNLSQVATAVIPVRLTVLGPMRLKSGPNPAGSGTVTPIGTSWYTALTTATLAAVPNAGWVFGHWSGDASGTTSVGRVFMNAHKTVTGNFTRIAGPDLGAVIWDVAPLDAITSRPVAINATIFNDGTEGTTKPVRVEFWAVNLRTRWRGSLMDSLLLPRGLAAGAAVDVPSSPPLILKANIPTGPYRIEMKIDASDAVAESNEQDNLVTWSTLMVYPDLANLRVEEFDFSPEDIHTTGGDSLRFSGRIVNAGSQPTTSPFWIEFRVWPATAFRATGPYLTASHATTTTLAPGEFIDLAALSPRIAEALPPGRYSVGILVDAARQVPEQNESDNIVQRYLKYLHVGPRATAVDRWSIYR